MVKIKLKQLVDLKSQPPVIPKPPPLAILSHLIQIQISKNRIKLSQYFFPFFSSKNVVSFSFVCDHFPFLNFIA